MNGLQFLALLLAIFFATLLGLALRDTYIIMRKKKEEK